MIKIQSILQFFTYDIWRVRLKSCSKPYIWMIQSLRILLSSVSRFIEDKCSLRASALTYYSLLSIVPVVAAAFGIAKGFGFEQRLEIQIIEKFSEQQEVMTHVIEFSNRLLKQTQGGLIAGIGVFVLLWTVIKLLENIETSFNDIWRIKKSRRWVRKFSDYLAMIVICPLLFTFVSSLTIFLSNAGPDVARGVFLKGMTVVLTWLLFSIVYLVMPNTKVRFSSALVGGIIAGTAFLIVQWLYIKFQIGVARYGAIYGSFAALPLFLIWLQISWLITLLGSEVSFAMQFVSHLEFHKDVSKITHRFRKLASLMIVKRCVTCFLKKESPQKKEDIAESLELPITLVGNLLNLLVEGGVLIEVWMSNKQGYGYQPAHDVADLKIKDVIDSIEGIGSDKIQMSKSSALNNFKQSLDSFNHLLEDSKDNLLIKDI